MTTTDDSVRRGPAFAEGGMGRVHEGVQTRLDRPVAVKVATAPALRPALVREARVTGRLEHPAIVPVYDLVDSDDGPMLVMKRIEGEAWDQLLHDPDAVEALGEEGDALDVHLRVLRQVCRAVQFAHERGVLHLDLKPGNVMVGDHGQVFLLDWGLAATLPGFAAIAGLPGLERRGVMGTPAYMAPEQAHGDGPAHGPATDVFGLGAMLAHVLTGEPRFAGRSVDDQLAGAKAAEVPPLDDAPVELADLVRRAMAASAADRPRSADAFRRALLAFDRHRSAVAFAEAALRRLDVLTEVVAVGARGEPMNTTAAHQALVEARFGFRQALREWPEHPSARDALDRALALGTRFELLRGNPLAAEQLLGAMRDPDPDLYAAVVAQKAEDATAREAAKKLKALRRDASPRAWALHRAVLGGFLFALIVALSAWMVIEVRWDIKPFTYPTVFGSLGLFDLAIPCAVGILWSVGRLNAFGVAQTRFLLAVTAMLNVWWAAAWMLGLDLPLAFAVHALVCASGLLTIGTAFDRPIVVPALAYLGAFVATLAAPGWTVEWFALSNVVAWGSYTLFTSWAGRSR